MIIEPSPFPCGPSSRGDLRSRTFGCRTSRSARTRLDAGIDLRAATVWAIRAASLKVTRPATISGLPTAAEVAALRQS